MLRRSIEFGLIWAAALLCNSTNRLTTKHSLVTAEYGDEWVDICSLEGLKGPGNRDRTSHEPETCSDTMKGGLYEVLLGLCIN